MMSTDPAAPRSRHERAHDDKTLEVLGRIFRVLNRQMVQLWRLGLGRWAESWPAAMGRILVLEHYGRSSGRRYLTPLNFTRDGGAIHCVAAFGASADWFRNIAAAGEGTVFLPNGSFDVRMVDVSDSERRVGLIRSVLKDTGFATHLAGIDPRSMPDDELADATAAYRVVRFDAVSVSSQRLDDRRWVLPTIAAVGLGALALRELRRRR